MQRFLFSALLLLICAPAPGLAGDAAGEPAALRLTIGQAVSLALDKNPALRQSANQVTSGEINLKQKQQTFPPTCASL